MKHSIVRNAFLMAHHEHRNQSYGTPGVPYTVHLYDVVRVLIEFGFRAERLIAAAWLHDIIEDTPCNYYDVLEATSDEVADIVYAVTDELGKNRRERKEKTLPKLKGFEDAMAVKLADRIANVRDAHINTPNTLNMYRKDWPEFKEFWHPASPLHPMWKELEFLLEKNDATI